MNFKDLETLMQVVHLGSFAAAAREQNVDPSSVSRAVSALESELGTRLFARNTRHLALTEAGSLFTERLPLLLETTKVSSPPAPMIVLPLPEP